MSDPKTQGGIHPAGKGLNLLLIVGYNLNMAYRKKVERYIKLRQDRRIKDIMADNSGIFKVICNDCLEELDKIPENSIDAIVTDPPYELGFMGKSWDNAGVSFQKETWAKCLRVLKPGGYLLAFGGTRTFHRIACAIEDGGFEIRDTIMWLYGQGFPKSMSLSKGIEAKEKLGNAGTRNKRRIEQACHTDEYILKQTNNGAMGEIIETTRKEYIPNTELSKKWDGWGTCLKPSFEPIIVARKPFKGSLVDNVMECGVGGLNIDECRVGDETIRGGTTPGFRDVGRKSKATIGIAALSLGQVEGAKRKPLEAHIGRFPANTILTYDETNFDEVCGGFPQSKGGSGKAFKKDEYDYGDTATNSKRGDSKPYNDDGSAARYFKNCPFSDEDLEEIRSYYYCPKASKKDRNEGLGEFKAKTKVFNGKSDKPSREIKDVEARVTTKARNYHPTVKPTSLMQYLVRLVSPRGATILDPFMGSGSTGKAVAYENKERDAGYKFIGIEKDPEYCKIAEARLTFAVDKDKK